MAQRVSDDVLNVRSYPERVLVDLRAEIGDEFITIDHAGITLHVGYERIALGWEATKQLVEVIGTAEKVFRGKEPILPRSR